MVGSRKLAHRRDVRGTVRCLTAVLVSCGLLLVSELPANPSFLRDGEPDSIGLWVHNDLFGPGPVSEWDDTRTFGVEIVSTLGGRFIAEAGYDLLTWRGTDVQEAGRIDVARALVGWRPPDLWVGPLLLDTRVEGGIEALGNLGGAVVQRWLHGTMRVSRPIPETYDSYSAVAPAAAAAARLRWEGEAVGAALVASVEGEWGVGARGGVGMRLWAGPADGRIRLTVRALLDPVRGRTPTLDATSVSESGVIVGMDCSAGRARAFLEHNLSTGVSNGGYGLLFDLSASGSRATLPVAVEVSCPMDCAAPGQRVYLGLRDPRLRFYVSQSGGWWVPPEGGTTGLRFADYGAGVEGRLLAGLGCVELEAAILAGAFYSAVAEQTLDGMRSTRLSASWCAGARLESAFRVGIVEKGSHGHTTKTGIGVGCVLDARVPGSTAPSGRTGGLKLFAFGETR